MELKILKPRLSLNKAFLKVKPNRPEIEVFKKNLISLIATIDEFESEEFDKNLKLKHLNNNVNYSEIENLPFIHRIDIKACSLVGNILNSKKVINKQTPPYSNPRLIS